MDRRLSPQERTARIIYRVLRDLADFPDSKKPEVMKRVVELLREDDWNSIADFVEPLTRPYK